MAKKPDDKTIIADIGGGTIFRGEQRSRAKLVQYSGVKRGHVYPLDDDEQIIGRAPGCKIIIAEPSISRQHAKITQNPLGIFIEDLGSSNGTMINDVKVIDKSVLRTGDMLRMGIVLFKFYAEDNIDTVLHDEMFSKALIDAGTEIFNKRHVLDSLAAEIRYAHTYGSPLALIYYDLDHFKKVNDVYGHGAGDLILKETAAIVKKAIRKDDIFGRYGGEEFVIILPNTDAQTAAELAERIRDTVAKTVFRLETLTQHGRTIIEHFQTLSMGVSEINSEMTTSEALLESADKKLYLSKSQGRNRVTV